MKLIKTSISITGIICSVLIAMMIFMQNSADVEAAKNITIAIDAGHGGENLGADYNNMIEKDATLKVARAMKEELEKYDGVTVLMTRTDDSDIAIDDRVAAVAPQKPDAIISLHFNMSENHTEDGSEMWISSREDLYNKAYRFAAIELNLLEDYGIRKRGIFIRLNSQEEDFYGIIRYASAKNIPAIILEHCYFDHKNDEGYYETNKALEKLGKIDATAVAMTYRLKSSLTGADYSSYKNIDVTLPSTVIEEDLTPPSLAHIEPDDYDDDTGILQVYVDAYDDESCITSCRYTLDGGTTVSDDIPWGQEGSMIIEIPVKKTEKEQKLRFYIKNSYGLESYSNSINLSELLWDADLDTTTIHVDNEKHNLVSDVYSVADSDNNLQFNEVVNQNTQHLKLLVPISCILGTIFVGSIFFFYKKLLFL